MLRCCVAEGYRKTDQRPVSLFDSVRRRCTQCKTGSLYQTWINSCFIPRAGSGVVRIQPFSDPEVVNTKPGLSLFCWLVSSVIQMYVVFIVSLFLVVSTSAIDCLERLVSEMTYYIVSGGTLNPTHSLTHVSFHYLPVVSRCPRLESAAAAAAVYRGNKSVVCQFQIRRRLQLQCWPLHCLKSLPHSSPSFHSSTQRAVRLHLTPTKPSFRLCGTLRNKTLRYF